MNTVFTPLLNDMVAAIAMSLYQYNVAPVERAARLYEHFEGVCAEPDELVRLVDLKNWATGMAFPTAKQYMRNAMERYGKEATNRVMIENIYGEKEKAK